jgi:hypothetical protein
VDQRAEWVRRVLGVVVSSGSPYDGSRTSEVSYDAEQVRERINELGVRLRGNAILLKNPDLVDALATAVKLFKADDLAGASARLEFLENALAQGSSASRAASDIGGGVSLRQVAAAGLEWRKLCGETAQRIAELKAFILEAMRDDDDYEPDDIDIVRGNLTRLDEVTMGMRDAISDMMDELINLPPQERAGHVETIRKALDEQETFLASNEVVAAIDANDAVPIGIAKLAGAAIDAMRSALA